MEIVGWNGEYQFGEIMGASDPIECLGDSIGRYLYYLGTRRYSIT